MNPGLQQTSSRFSRGLVIQAHTWIGRERLIGPTLSQVVCPPRIERVVVGRETKQLNTTASATPINQMHRRRHHLVPAQTNTTSRPVTATSRLSPFTLSSLNHGRLMAEPRNRKRQQIPELSQSNPPPKKAKLKRESNFSPVFWDNLSKIWLTPCALRELNRRNSAYTLPILPEVYPTDLARFARHGGPDLCHLRGVRVHRNRELVTASTNRNHLVF